MNSCDGERKDGAAAALQAQPDLAAREASIEIETADWRCVALAADEISNPVVVRVQNLGTEVAGQK